MSTKNNHASADWLASTRRQLEEFLHRSEGEGDVHSTSTLHQNTAGLDALRQFIRTRQVPPEWSDLSPLLARRMLVSAALGSLERIPDLPVDSEVKQLICKDYRSFCAETTVNDPGFEPGSPRFSEMAALACLEEFDAGQVHWRISGIPRSWLAKMQWRTTLRMLSTVAGMGGFAPCFEAHIPRREPPFLIEREHKRSYLRIARSMELQPAIRGIMAASWLHAEETIAVTPHLAWINRLFLDAGGILAHLGPADENSGFLVGSPKRQALYESGAYRPRVALFVWPRAALLRWARLQEAAKPPSATDTAADQNALPRNQGGLVP